MGKGWLLGTLIAGGLLGGTAGAETQDPQVARGQIAYQRYCVACHGSTGRGDGSIAKDLRVPVPDLTTLAKRSGGRYPADRVQSIIANGEVLRGHGTPDMPAWGDAFQKTRGTEAATPAEAISNLVEYLRSIQAKAP
jgi:mono/diheme cytochrome c family protein